MKNILYSIKFDFPLRKSFQVGHFLSAIFHFQTDDVLIKKKFLPSDPEKNRASWIRIVYDFCIGQLVIYYLLIITQIRRDC